MMKKGMDCANSIDLYAKSTPGTQPPRNPNLPGTLFKDAYEFFFNNKPALRLQDHTAGS